MQKMLAKSIAGGAVVGLLSLAGMQLASAQDTTSTTTPATSSTAPSATAKTPPAHSGSDANCPNMGSGGGAPAAPSASS